MTQQLSDSNRVPPEASVLVDLLNTRPRGRKPDRLATDSPLVGIRAALLATLRHPESGWAAVTRQVESVAFRPVLASATDVRFEQTAGDPAVGSVALAITDLVGSGAWSRLKLCANENCGDLFYDTTRSRTQRWHAYEVCGNRANVRAFRARASGSPAPVSAEG